MKIAGCILMFFLFVSCGFYASNQLEKRIRQLKSLEKAVMSMKREIDYRLSPLGETLLHTAKRTEHPWCLFFERAGQSFQGGKRTDGKSMELCFPDEIFRRELITIRQYHPWEKDLKVLVGLGKNLGELDKKMQIMKFTMVEEEIKDLIGEAQEEKKTKGKLYQTLGACMGIVSVILVI